MVKVAGYILGEFGNLIAGDQRSSPSIQFQLLHSKYHLCSVPTRALLMTTYIKFINLFPEIRSEIQAVLNQDSNIRSSDAELQQRTVEYLQLSQIAPQDLLATVLEEMPAFRERESSILAILKKKKPGMGEAAPPVPKDHRNHNAESAAKIVSATTNDLLGLNSSMTGGGQSAASLLVDVFDNFNPVPAAVSAGDMIGGGNIVVSCEEGLRKLVCKNNGVLFENNLIQIGVKSEFKRNLGIISIFYGNKTTSQFISFTPHVVCPGDLSGALNIQVKPVEPVIEAGAQVQQALNIECVEDFKDRPTLLVTFFCAGEQQRFSLYVPLTINKFFESTAMDGERFFERWKNLNDPSQEAQKIFKAKYPMDPEAIRAKLAGFGMEVLDGIDPNKSNYVTAGVIHTKMKQVGCLLRLEPNTAAQMYRLTIRSSKDSVSQQLCELLHDQF